MKKLLFAFVFFLSVILAKAQSEMLWMLNYDNVNPCLIKDDTYLIYKDGKTGLADKYGKVIIPLEVGNYESSHQEKFCIMRNRNYCALYDIEKGNIIPYSSGYNSFFILDNVIEANKDGKWGILDLQGKVISQCQYSKTSHFYGGLASVTDEDGVVGVINTQGKIIIPFDYEDYSSHYKDIFVMKKNKLYGMVNTKGKIICPFKYETLAFGDGSSGLAVYVENNLSGYINYKGEIVVPAKYKFANSFYKNRAEVQNENGLWGYIDEKGKELIPCQFIERRSLSNKYEPVQLARNQYVFIDWFGKNVLDTIFEDSGFFINDKIAFTSNAYNKKGIYHINKKQILPIEYNLKMNGSLIMAKGNDKFILLDTSGRIIDTFDGCAEFENFGFNFAFPIGVKKNDNWGFIDKTGKLIINYQFDTVNSFVKSSFMFANKNKKWGVIDKNIQVLIPFEYDACIDNAVSNAMIMQKNGKQGVINEKNDILIPFIYDKIKKLTNGKFFKFYQNDKQGVFSTKNQQIIAAIYDNIEMNEKGDAFFVRQNGKFGAINLEGKQLVSVEYDAIEDIPTFAPHKGFLISKGSKKGYINLQNQVLIPCKYENCTFHLNGFIVGTLQRSHLDLYSEKAVLLGSDYREAYTSLNSIIPYIIVENQEKYSGAFFQSGKTLPCTYSSIKLWKKLNPQIIANTDVNNFQLFDDQGNMVKKFSNIRVAYQISSSFYEIKSNQTSQNNFGIIDTLGNIIFEPIYEYGSDINEENYLLVKEKQSLIFDKNTGKVSVNLDYDEVKNFSNNENRKNLLICKKGILSGVLNSKGEILFLFEYEKIEESERYKTSLIGTKNGKKYLLHSNGTKELMKE